MASLTSSPDRSTLSDVPSPTGYFRNRFQWALGGVIWGIFFALAALTLYKEAIPLLLTENFIPLCAVVGALVAVTRRRFLLWAPSLILTANLLIVVYTPLTASLLPTLIREDPLRSAPAVVVLSASNRRDGSFSGDYMARLTRGYELVGEGYAPLLVITRPAPPYPSHLPRLQEHLRRIGLDIKVAEVLPEVTNTRDEALGVARMAEDNGWDRVILVTHPWHMRRAKAVFEKTGLEVIAAPGNEPNYIWSQPTGWGGRSKAYRDWVHETIGYYVYRWRGWI